MTFLSRPVTRLFRLARLGPVPQLRPADLDAFGMAGACAWNISHRGFLMHPGPGFHYAGTGQPAS